MAAYIDTEYYSNIFNGSAIPPEEFERLAQMASDFIDSVVYLPIKDVTDNVKRATAYQMEMLYSQGGVDAVTGNASASAGTERLGDYSISGGTSSGNPQNGSTTLMVNGIPISALAVSLLRREGLMRRWAYAGWRCGDDSE